MDTFSCVLATTCPGLPLPLLVSTSASMGGNLALWSGCNQRDWFLHCSYAAIPYCSRRGVRSARGWLLVLALVCKTSVLIGVSVVLQLIFPAGVVVYTPAGFCLRKVLKVPGTLVLPWAACCVSRGQNRRRRQSRKVAFGDHATCENPSAFQASAFTQPVGEFSSPVASRSPAMGGVDARLLLRRRGF
jgi:hypothetical protein